MEWKIEYLADEKLLYIKTKGVLTKEEANSMLRDVVQAMGKYACQKQLVDHRDTVFELTILEYYERPDINKEIGMPYTWKIAMVFKELTENTRFMETVFRNRGYNFRQFDDIDEARAWVLGE
ncbi:MAG TPA: hypothetical protein DEP19_05380 [Anaerolineae bacterium]|nr:hypothetical protein [Anaerolineae bacterium]HCK67443.1 hypothetical protein [Anaerolineae bacterium]